MFCEFRIEKKQAKANLIARYGGPANMDDMNGSKRTNNSNSFNGATGLKSMTQHQLIAGVIDSLSDAVCTLRMSTSSVDEMINMLAKRFRPKRMFCHTFKKRCLFIYNAKIFRKEDILNVCFSICRR